MTSYSRAAAGYATCESELLEYRSPGMIGVALAHVAFALGSIGAVKLAAFGPLCALHLRGGSDSGGLCGPTQRAGVCVIDHAGHAHAHLAAA